MTEANHILTHLKTFYSMTPGMDQRAGSLEHNNTEKPADLWL